jgi:hypothetical protein
MYVALRHSFHRHDMVSPVIQTQTVATPSTWYKYKPKIDRMCCCCVLNPKFQIDKIVTNLKIKSFNNKKIIKQLCA